MESTQTRDELGAMRCAANVTCLQRARACAAASAWPGIHRAVVEFTRGQRLHVTADDAQWIRTVHCGLLALCASLPDGRRQIICLAGPGEALCSCSAPGTVCEVRIPAAVAAVGDGHAQALLSLLQLTRTRLERTLAHVVTLGRLDGRERLVSFLVDMALRFGQIEDGQWSVNIPMTREDMADHLGLNADTVTRILGRLKREGVVLASSAHDFVIPHVDGMSSGVALTSSRVGASADA